MMRAHVRIGTEVVDGFRGVAIVLVVCYHTWLFSWYTPSARILGYALPVDVLPRVGYLGVDLFFVISGFCLCVPLARAMVDGTPHPRWGDFYLARALKIVPSYLIVLAATVPFALEDAGGRSHVAAALLTHLVFAQTFWGDPFGQVNSVLWSIAIEVQFYVVFPLVAFAFVRAPWLATLGGVMLAGTYRAYFAACCLQTETVSRQLPAFADLFVCGMAAAYALFWLRRHAPWLRRRGWPGTLVAAATVMIAWRLLYADNAVQYVPAGRESWELLGRTWLALDLGVFIVAASLSLRIVRAALANGALVFLSLISYNLYLWHTLLLIWLWHHNVLHAATPDPHDDDAWKLRYIAVGWAACLAVATTITYVIERPLLGLRRPHAFALNWRSVLGRGVGPTQGRKRTRERRA